MSQMWYDLEAFVKLFVRLLYDERNLYKGFIVFLKMYCDCKTITVYLTHVHSPYMNYVNKPILFGCYVDAHVCHRYTREIPDLVYCPHVMVSSAMGLELEVFGFLSTTQAKTNAKQMCPWSSHTVWCFMHVYLYVQTAVDALT